MKFINLSLTVKNYLYIAQYCASRREVAKQRRSPSPRGVGARMARRFEARHERLEIACRGTRLAASRAQGPLA